MHGQQNIKISIPGFSNWCLTFKFHHHNPVFSFLFPPIRATWPTDLFSFYSMTLPVSGVFLLRMLSVHTDLSLTHPSEMNYVVEDFDLRS